MHKNGSKTKSRLIEYVKINFSKRTLNGNRITKFRIITITIINANTIIMYPEFFIFKTIN